MDLSKLIESVENIRHHALEEESKMVTKISAVHTLHKDGAKNLIHYLKVRTFDLRALQKDLSALGISSIGHSEGYTLENIQNILTLLHLLNGQNTFDKHTYSASEQSYALLEQKADQLLGRNQNGNRIMVTMPASASEDLFLIRTLLEAGMNIARINTGKDDEETWLSIVENIRKVSDELGTNCKIYMDLGGPKLRTGKVAKMQEDKKKKKKKKKTGILLHIGDTIQLHSAPIAGCPPLYDELDRLIQPAVISISLPSVLDDIKIGQKVWFDDGKIGGVVENKNDGFATIRITYAGLKGSLLQAKKGINLPETEINLPSLTMEDLKVLPFIAKHADLVGYSFVRTADDVLFLQEKLKELNREDIGIVLKVETRITFQNLPAMLLTTMTSPNVGVMIARGDLAVEVGFERISEIQEELLWLCEAAHIPVIWATQVLDNLAKKGQATRAEITDAAMSTRAECAMLNKGPFIVEAVKTLSEINKRMQAHQRKKMATLRPLWVAQGFFTPKEEGTPF